uniref:PiggyBac transposable element-derived protein 4-like n=1 Tax=Mastacembelus armatus TaxID=205130 RepID=A0A3Q3L1L6_9TELE
MMASLNEHPSFIEDFSELSQCSEEDQTLEDGSSDFDMDSEDCFEDPDFDCGQTSDDSEWELEVYNQKRPRLTSPISSPTKSPGRSPRRLPGRSPGQSNRGRGKAASPDAAISGTAADWHDMDEPDVEPSKPPFKPTRTPGPQLINSSTYSPLQLFNLFFTSSVMQTILANSNAYGELKSQGLKRAWKAITEHELYAFISLVIYMGFVKCSAISDYWCKSAVYSLPLPSKIMPRRRFQAILASLHLSHPQVDAENEKKKGTPAYDCLCKIKPLYGQIVEACKSNFQPFQSIAIDERMVKSKSRSKLKQYMKDKPTKWGYKLFVLADSSCGYTWNFFIYEGKAVMENGKGVGYDSVMKLLDQKVLGTGYKLFVDNFYTSPKLFQDLLKSKILACGTIRRNRTEGKIMAKKAARGTIHWIRQNNLLFVSWMDTREVLMCSTMHKAFDGDTVKRRIKGKNKEWSLVNVPVPPAVKEYNQYVMFFHFGLFAFFLSSLLGHIVFLRLVALTLWSLSVLTGAWGVWTSLMP